MNIVPLLLTRIYFFIIFIMDIVHKFYFCFSHSARLNERKVRGQENNKKIAYLLDMKTIAVGEIHTFTPSYIIIILIIIWNF